MKNNPFLDILDCGNYREYLPECKLKINVFYKHTISGLILGDHFAVFEISDPPILFYNDPLFYQNKNSLNTTQPPRPMLVFPVCLDNLKNNLKSNL